MRKYLQILLFCPVFAFLCACNKDKLKAPEAAYLQIDTALVTVTTYSAQGTTSNKITDIWVYVDQQFKGAFPIGNLIPIVGNGSTDIIIYPGIKNNGISATRIPYPFLQGLNVNLNLTPGKTTLLKPKFPYKTGAHFQQVEGFEGTGSAITNAPDATCLSQIIQGPDAFEGVKYLSMSQNMVNANSVAVIQTSTSYPLPGSGATVYLELNYKTNQAVEIGVFNAGGRRLAITLNATTGWNKIYISLTDVVSTQPVFAYNGVYIRAAKLVSSPEIFIDNFKLISD